jgi:hypothetical protein
MKDDLSNGRNDYLAVVSKSLASAIPFAGGALAEIVGFVIPNQRQDRIVAYLRQLDDKIAQLENGFAEAIKDSGEKLDLIELGGRLSAKATSEERIAQIVEAVASGLSADEAKVIRQKRLLRLFGELDNEEVAILRAYGRAYAGGDPHAFDDLPQPEPVHLGSSIDAVRETALFDIGKKRLIDLGLLRKNLGNLKKGQLPEFDPKDGLPKGRVEISFLGRVLLREVGIEIPFED